MHKIEAKHISFNLRLFNINNFIILEIFLILCPVAFFIPNIISKIFYLFSLILISLVYWINKTKKCLNSITFHKDELILNGETYNKKWIEKIEIQKTKINFKIHSSKRICNTKYQIEFIQNNKKFIANNFNTFSDSDLIIIFTEFKKIKGEKIIIDENLVLNKIKEKIDKCQSNKTLTT